jgi:hypothetical protein
MPGLIETTESKNGRGARDSRSWASSDAGFRNPSTSPQPITAGRKPATAYRIAFLVRRSFSAAIAR